MSPAVRWDHPSASGNVTNSTPNTVSVIDTATNTVVATIAVGSSPHGVAVADVTIDPPPTTTTTVPPTTTTVPPTTTTVPAPADFDGNDSTDLSVFRPSDGSWQIRDQATVFLGATGDIPVACDYDGDRSTDAAVFRPAVGGWYVDGQAPVFFGLTGDIPGPDTRDFPSKLGGGPILVYKDNSCHYSPALTKELAGTAEREGISLQRAIFANYGSDGAPMLRRGVETALLTYPTRYTHSPIETVDEGDLRACVELLVAFCEGAG